MKSLMGLSILVLKTVGELESTLIGTIDTVVEEFSPRSDRSSTPTINTLLLPGIRHALDISR